MLEKFIKKDSNEILENVLAQKDVDERTKNLLQGILYKIDVSYKDYQNAKVIQRNKKEYVDEINKNIKRKCNKIVTVSFNEKIEEEKIKKSLEKNKFYIDENQIITYPIEEKILYAIEKSINNNKIVNSKYEIISEPLSNLIMTGKSLDRVEVLRDFNGWSWTTIKTEIESISSNLVYQILQILLGEEFMDNWSFDTDGIIDYYSMFKEQISNKYGIENAKKLYEIIEKIAIMNEIEQDIDFKSEKIQQLNEIDNDIKKRTNVEQYITELTEEKKKAEKEIAVIQKILSSEKELKNQNSPTDNLAKGGINKTGKAFNSVVSSGEVINGNVVPPGGPYIATIPKNGIVINPAESSVRSKQAIQEKAFARHIRKNAEVNDGLS